MDEKKYTRTKNLFFNNHNLRNAAAFAARIFDAIRQFTVVVIVVIIFINIDVFDIIVHVVVIVGRSGVRVAL